MKLNKYQQQASDHREGPCVVMSVPGSGKTRVLVERGYGLIKEGLDPRRLICLTFTNKAGKEMKERLKKRLNVSRIDSFMGTFHSLCSRILRRFHKEAGLDSNYTILDSGDQKTLIKKTIKLHAAKYEKDVSKDLIMSVVNDFRESLIEYSDEWKDDNDPEGRSPEQIFMDASFSQLEEDSTPELIEAHKTVARGYLEDIKKHNTIDFSGLLYEAFLLMHNHDKVREYIQNSHDYLMVDEVQDTNYVQFRIVDLMSKKHNNVFLVGDPQQSVYGFRNARFENMQDFLDGRNPLVIELPINYRSTPQIVNVANALIKNNKTNTGADIMPVRDKGNPVVWTRFPIPEEEANGIADYIKSGHSNGRIKYEDTAILYRVNSMSRPIEESFRRLNIPYKVIGGFSFYERAEVKDCLSMLKLVANPKDAIAFTRVSDCMKGVGIKTIDKVDHAVRSSGLTFLDACKEIVPTVPAAAKGAFNKFIHAYSNIDSKSPGTALMGILNSLDYHGHLKAHFATKAKNKIDNIGELVNSISTGPHSELSVGEYLQEIQLITSGSEEEEERGTVTLMSMHASKGTEYPFVFIVGFDGGQIPHFRAIQDDPDNIEEERRLFYVGITRAQDRLFISSCEKRPIRRGRAVEYVPTERSVFFEEIIPEIHHQGGIKSRL